MFNTRFSPLDTPIAFVQVPISVKSTRPAALTFTHAKYDFLSLLPSMEPLPTRGQRLQETALQRQTATYSAEKPIQVEVEEATHRLLANFIDDGRLVLAEGEVKETGLWLSNAGAQAIRELWMVAGSEDEVWVRVNAHSENHSPGETSRSLTHAFTLFNCSDSASLTEIYHSRNLLTPRKPYRIDLTAIHGLPILEPGGNIEFSLLFHVGTAAENDLCLLFVFREVLFLPLLNCAFH
jgi:trafficking protein particle complex subunit 8